MEFKDKFDNYKNDYTQLLGKKVLYEYGQSFSKNRNRYIREIVKVTKTGFRIKDHDKSLFNFAGHEKGLNDRQNWSTVSTCTLLTNEEATEIAKTWAFNKYKKELFEEVNKKLTENKDKITVETLRKIIDLLGE